MTWISDSALAHLRQTGATPALIEGRYRLIDALGQGGMGTVYRAEDRELRREVALKVLREERADDDAMQRALREARVLAQLEHPGIVPVHDVGRLPDGRVFYVMKIVRGRRLDQHFDAGSSLRDRLRVFERICETVAFAHAQGVLHRDLKPQNVMIGPFGEVLVLDWGVAKLQRDPHGREATSSASPAAQPSAPAPKVEPADDMSTHTRPTARGTIIGTPGYMAPEQARGDTDAVDPRTDVFGLGGILYFLLTRRPPRGEPGAGDADGRRARLGERSIPRRLRSICLKALHESPSQRYESADALRADVGRFLNDEAVSAHRESLGERGVRLFTRYQAVVLLVLAYLLLRGVFSLWLRN